MYIHKNNTIDRRAVGFGIYFAIRQKQPQIFDFSDKRY